MSLTELYNVRKVGADGRRFAIGESGPSTAPPPQRCAICRAAAARYTCPRCQAPYCALTCFRAESHQACATPFVDQTLRSELSAQPDKAKVSEEERREMLELLRKLRASGTEEAEEESENSEEADEALETLELPPGLDLDTASPETLLDLLSHEQKNAFMAAVQSQKAEVVESDEELPWWESGMALSIAQSFTEAVSALELPASSSAEEMPSLAGNTIAVLLTYAHVVRALGVRSLHTLTPPREPKKEAPIRVNAVEILQPASIVEGWSDMPPLEPSDAPIRPPIASTVASASSNTSATPDSAANDPTMRLKQLLQEERASQLRRAQAMLSKGVPFLLAAAGEVARTRLGSVEEAGLTLLATVGGGKEPAAHLAKLLSDVLSFLFPPVAEADVHPLHVAFSDLTAALPRSKRKLVFYAATWAAQQGKGAELVRAQIKEQKRNLEAELDRAMDEERWAAAYEKESEISHR